MGPRFEQAIGSPDAIPSKSVIGIVSQLDAKMKISEEAIKFGSSTWLMNPTILTNKPLGSDLEISLFNNLLPDPVDEPTKRNSKLYPRSRSFFKPLTTSH